MNWIRLNSLIALLMAGGVTVVSIAAPAQVILLSHAEKPAKGNELSNLGWSRANALVKFFSTDARTQEHGPIAAIFAMKQAAPGTSVRPIETMTPTATALHLVINVKFEKDDIALLAKVVLGDPQLNGKTVVICWEHKELPDIAKALGWKNAPSHWDDSVYDRYWVLDFSDGKPIAFRDLPQRLITGDTGM